MGRCGGGEGSGVGTLSDGAVPVNGWLGSGSEAGGIFPHNGYALVIIILQHKPQADLKIIPICDKMDVMNRWRTQLIVLLVCQLAMAGYAYADSTMTSSNWSVAESEIGGSGQFNQNSSSYSTGPSIDDGGSSLGESVVGNSSSTSYQTNAGFNTTAQPGLMMTVNQTSMSLGVLSTASTSSTTATFTASDYTSSGYIVQVIGTPPTYGSHQLTAMGNNTSPASAGAAEQFGLNLRANNSPSVAGSADPLEVPDNQTFDNSSFSHGQAGNYAQGGTTYGTNMTYSVPNKYTYNSGDVIASSSRTSGPTLFTISFLANITTTTPAGQYSGSLTFVATGTF
jgi:hypothetical protein